MPFIVVESIILLLVVGSGDSFTPSYSRGKVVKLEAEKVGKAEGCEAVRQKIGDGSGKGVLEKGRAVCYVQICW